jgi:hypothetical protein
VASCTRAVDLVDDHDRLEAHREGLLGHEAGLRHRTVEGIDEDQDRVDHRQHAFHFAAEVGMSRGVDDVDAVLGTVTLVGPADRGVLRENRDAAFLFDVVRVHHAVRHDLAVAERARLAQQAVDEGGLAMVDVGDDGDVAQLFDGHR